MTLQKGGLPIVTNNALWLASASPRRLALLEQIGVIPDHVVHANIDETPLKQELARDYAVRMAVEKSNHTRHQMPESEMDFVLTADTVVAVGRRILPKAETIDEARQCLKLLSGRAHRVYTAMCLTQGAVVRVKCVQTRVQMKRLDATDLAWYIDTQDWKGKAGGYAIQGPAAAFIRNIQGSYSSVVGLPLYETANLLKGCGYRF